ncbi:unnamed protein product [Closterium sp. Naga37s-1]|nr:unnamed protein product [Closterium sp. Naga37s-1]
MLRGILLALTGLTLLLPLPPWDFPATCLRHSAPHLPLESEHHPLLALLSPSSFVVSWEIVKDNILHHFRGDEVWCDDHDVRRGMGGVRKGVGIVGHGDPEVYHMSIFHASHHLSPVPATAKQQADEVRAVKGVSKRLCPPRVSLDRVSPPLAVVRELWNVEEMDVLALALQGNMSVKRFNLTCIQPDWVGTI